MQEYILLLPVFTIFGDCNTDFE